MSNKSHRGSIWLGIAIGIGLTVIMILFLLSIAGTFPSGQGVVLFGLRIGPGEGPVTAIFLIGAAQLLWMLPAGLAFGVRKKWETVKGLVIFAAIIALLNAACFGLMFSGGGRLKG